MSQTVFGVGENGVAARTSANCALGAVSGLAVAGWS